METSNELKGYGRRPPRMRPSCAPGAGTLPAGTSERIFAGDLTMCVVG